MLSEFLFRKTQVFGSYWVKLSIYDNERMSGSSATLPPPSSHTINSEYERWLPKKKNLYRRIVRPLDPATAARATIA